MRTMISPAHNARSRHQREAMKAQLRAAATQGPPVVTEEDLEFARRSYVVHLDLAQLARENDSLSLDERVERAKQHIESSEVDRLNYEHKLRLYEAQQRRAAAEEATKLTLANIQAAEAQATAAQKQAEASKSLVGLSRVQTDLAKTQAEAARVQAEAGRGQAIAAKVQADAAKKQTITAVLSAVIALLVGLAIVIQTGFLIAQYELAKWEADHQASAIGPR